MITRLQGVAAKWILAWYREAEELRTYAVKSNQVFSLDGMFFLVVSENFKGDYCVNARNFDELHNRVADNKAFEFYVLLAQETGKTAVFVGSTIPYKHLKKYLQNGPHGKYAWVNSDFVPRMPKKTFGHRTGLFAE